MVRSLLALALLFPASLVAQEITPEDSAAFRASWEAIGKGRYMEPDAALRARAFDAAGQPRPGRVHDEWADIQGLLTNRPAARVPVPGITPGDPADTSPARLTAATPRDAIGTIVERAKRTRVVFLNEDHASPRDRAFGLEVARALRPLGYDVLAVETLSNQPDDARSAADMAKLVRDGYPRRFTGTYTRDPVFADFLRQSLALGYRPVAYETTDHERDPDWKVAIARREQAQADYLIRRAVKAYPRSKILVYVGFSHATERPDARDRDGEPLRWLATRFKAMTGIDPLTIEQTTLNEDGSGDARAHAMIAGRIGPRPAVFFDGDRPLVVGQYRGLMDVQVAHPPARLVNGRVDWLAAMGRTPTPVPAQYLPTSGTRLVQAFVAAEAGDAVPVDQVLVTAGQAPPMLMLPKVPVRYAVQDAVTPPVAAGATGAK